MIKGRRQRNTNGTKSSVAASAKTVTDDTASPKRKDLKFDLHNTDANVSVALKNDSMVLRGGRLKTVDISRYLQPTARCKNAPTVQPVAAPRNADRFIDITDENTCDSFDAPQPADDDDVCITAITTRNEHETKSDGPRIIPHRNNHNNNNIFLQEPVLSLNFDKTPTSPNRPRLLIQNPSFIAAELNGNRFPSPSQPKSDSLWNGIASMANCHTNGSGMGLLGASANSAHEHPHALDLSKPTQVTQIDSTTASTVNACLHQEDSNSCDSGDSGVVILSGNEGQSGTSSSPVMPDSRLGAPGNHTTPIAERRKKPSTPHRILCPSPVKNAIVCLPTSTAGGLGSSPLGNIHKSRRGANKTRKRLNAKHAPHENAPDGKPHGVPGDDSSSRSTNETNTLKIHDNEMQSTAPARQLIVLPPPSTKGSVVGGNKKITEFYPVRRSVRKTKKEVQVERDRDIELAIREGREEGLQIGHFEGKGRGIVTTRKFSKGEFVVEYIGDLITVAEAKQREQKYAEDDNTGCYMYYFKHKNIQHCIDATAESGKLGRLVNHSRNGNLVTKTVLLNNRPHLVLIAKDDIEKGVEITYDYGDRSKEALQYYPWLAL
ncbi:histone-lysine N-methyltransferase PR-Set7-like [Anopheles albimanus]|uniref:[histone H4]-lysine(20) N-methyltransferase n=1 Tax=Anopheles albimanus TaxID=7167 RepID=A0A182FLY0_ANOAL|nr:histone-lysine N-methyltransferase PR-Set7-like [Anopheles albimanus]